MTREKPAALGSVPEGYVSRAVMAKLLGVSVRMIDVFVTEGMPSETWGMKRTRRFLPSQALAWAKKRGKIAADRDRNQTAPGDQDNRRSSFDA